MAQAVSNDEEFKLQILHTGDLHAHFAQTDTNGDPCLPQYAKEKKCFGGFPRVKYAMDEQRRIATLKGIPSIFVNVGDNFKGSVYYKIYKWRIVSDFIKRMEFDVMCLGNHEFDDGIDDTVRYLQSHQIPTVDCNLNFTSEMRLLNATNLKTSWVKEINGKRVGFVGHLTRDTPKWSPSENLEIWDEIPAIKAEAKRLKADGVDIIISLGHSGFEIDKKVAEEVEDISLVIGGHSHTFLYPSEEIPPSIETPEGDYPHYVTQASGKKVPVFHAYYFGKYLGNILVTFDKKGSVIKTEGKPILLDGQIPEDESVLKEVYIWNKYVKQTFKTVVDAVVVDGLENELKKLSLDLD